MAVAPGTRTPQTAATVTGDFSGFLKPEMAAPIFEQARKSSTVMQLARRVPMGPNGVEIPFTTAKPVAAWVAEGAKKPTTEGGLGLKQMVVKKIACITIVSEEVVRANPGGYLDIYRADVAEAFAVAFDQAALHGTNSPFGATNNIDATTKTVALGTATAAKGSVYGDIVAGLDALVKDGKKLTGFVFDREVEPLFLGSVDTAGRPLFIDAPPAADTTQVVTGGRLIGRESYLGDNVAHTPTGAGAKKILGYAGDWSRCAYGTVGSLTWRISRDAAVEINGAMVSTFQNNLVALLCEAEFSWLVDDAASFVKFTAA